MNYTGYIYDGLGRRIAKGTLDPAKMTSPLTAAACDITKNGFVRTNVYVPGPNGEQLDEADSSMNLVHSNIYANGQLLATVTPDNNLHFAFNDWLGTKRAVASASGTLEETCLSLPYGDELDCNGSDPSEQHFTGKERDQESGNDYFGARYYSSSMGRWLSPDYSYDYDPEPVPHADLENPQSLNLYSYVQNNPLINIDPDGHSCDQGSIGPDGVFTIHCQNDPPLNPWFAGGVMVLGNEELGPFAWGIGGALLGVGCLQAHCGQAIANLFASNNSNKAVPPAAAPANTANPNPNDNQDQKKKTSRNQMQKQVERGKAPKTVDRVDPGLGPNEQDHIHFSDGSALNEDGTWKHGGRPLTNAETEWIQQNGWNTPKQP